MRAALALAAGLLLSACGGFGGASGPPDDGRETVLLTPPADSVRYLVYPAILEGVFVRPARAAAPPGTEVGVEVLVKGTLPDACSELADATQTRRGHLIDMELTMRTPRGAVCAQIIRPFRFYLLLDGGYAPGHYTLTLNGTAYPFRIRSEGEAETLPDVGDADLPAPQRLPVE